MRTTRQRERTAPQREDDDDDDDGDDDDGDKHKHTNIGLGLAGGPARTAAGTGHETQQSRDQCVQVTCSQRYTAVLNPLYEAGSSVLLRTL